MADLFKRLRLLVDRMAAGTPVPAGLEPPDPAVRPRPTAHERTAIRRRLRTLRENGAGQPGEIEALERALAEDQRVVDLVAAGVATSCARCGSVASANAASCDECGAPLGAGGGEKPRDADRPTETLSDA